MMENVEVKACPVNQFDWSDAKPISDFVSGLPSMSGAVLKVSTEVMYTKAQEAEAQLGRMKQSFETMQNMVNSSTAYWQGEAGDTHRATYQACEKRAQEIFKRLQEHVTDLRSMAAGYDNAEKEAANLADMLSSDAII